MQQTRRYILDILRERGQVTVDDIVLELNKRRGSITAVTVRHHLSILQREELITASEFRRKNSPGRPQHTYMLTEKAQEHFPNNYQKLAESLLQTIQKHLPPDSVNVIIEGVADQFAQEAQIPNIPLLERLNMVVKYLNDNGYDADWEACEEGYRLHTANCPYHGITHQDLRLCDMDMRLISSLLGIVPRRVEHLADGDAKCSYLIPKK